MLNLKWCDQVYSVILLLSCFVICAHSDVPRPRGVSLAKASLYTPTKDFTCLDGTVTIPFSHVNDDYCDCFDGSDEPGTSACINGVFHCANAGHRSQNIPSSRVNDGVCDCCDGTDEYVNPDTCSNTCEELGKEARAEAHRLVELHKAGSQLRQELIEKGSVKRNEMAQQLSQLERDKLEAEKIREEKESMKNELESRENEVLKVYREAEEQERQKKAAEEQELAKSEAIEKFQTFDTDGDGLLNFEEVQTRNAFDKNRDGQIDEDEVKYFFNQQQSVDLETFISNTWPLLKPFLMMEQGLFRPPTKEGEEEETEHETDMNGEEEEENAGDGENEDIDGEQEDVENFEDLHQDDVELPLADDKKYDEETQKIVNAATEARSQHTQAERTVREIESNIRNIKENLQKDYGAQHEFATLDGQCFEHEDKEYVYKLCMFQKVTQKSKNSGSEVGLGNWGEWAGEQGDLYSAMKYTNGVACWNGPNRMTTVNIQCGLETQVLSVSEPYRCEYNMVLSSPAACDATKPSHVSHDEL